MLPEEFNEHKYSIKPSNPKCSNIECDFHKDPPPAKYGFVISVIEEGLMGKILNPKLMVSLVVSSVVKLLEWAEKDE